VPPAFLSRPHGRVFRYWTATGHRIPRVVSRGAERTPRALAAAADTGRRRVANEDQVWRALSKYGFEMVRLADHPLKNQIALVRGAKHIVAPHGMGLAHVSLHTGSPTVLELHNPAVGTDAFALMARAMGFAYDFIFGTLAGNEFDDFVVAPEAIPPALDRLGIAAGVQVEQQPRCNMVPASATFTGTWSPGAQLEELAAISHAMGGYGQSDRIPIRRAA
jgi:hypothetical protein